MRVSPAGAKAYVLKYRTRSGRVRWRSYGRTDGDLSLEQARALAEGDRGIVAAGGDPLREIDAAKKAETVAEVGERFLADLTARPKPAKAPTVRLYRLAFDQHIKPVLGALAIADVTDEDAAGWHRRLAATP